MMIMVTITVTVNAVVFVTISKNGTLQYSPAARKKKYFCGTTNG